jgi:hypothetical protein
VSSRDDTPLPVPSTIEVLASLLLGPDLDAPGPPPARGIGWRAAFDEVVLAALRRPPCLVSFSGGRDSSGVLAVAVDVARREGLPDPVPATMRFPGIDQADETKWQDVMLSHLGVQERVVVDIDTELDALGPAAVGVLRSLGVVWPANAYLHVPLLEQARGGSLLTGVGGDELFETRASAFVRVLYGRERPRLREAGGLALATLPRPARAAVWRRRHAGNRRWLTPAGNAAVDGALATEEVTYPHRWDRAMRYWMRSRGFQASRRVLTVMGASHDVATVSPHIEPSVLVELLGVGGATGFRSREEAMTRLFGDLVPLAVRRRTSKAVFNSPVWGPATRAFARDWAGHGVDPTLVDVDRLREEWQKPDSDFRTLLLLHTAWLAGQSNAATS